MKAGDQAFSPILSLMGPGPNACGSLCGRSPDGTLHTSNLFTLLNTTPKSQTFSDEHKDEQIASLKTQMRDQSRIIQTLVKAVEGLQIQLSAHRDADQHDLTTLKSKVAKLEGHILPALYRKDEQIAALEFDRKVIGKRVDQLTQKMTA
ncbi:hypothetical protein K458DRAFT_390894 [Lentithecium fluviatile CBS 122367]|uniref:Uncharacterized protein n=1 Tax=Lentithecium fluviatile CBS 122367 TaxID=1168545 RepID=A0A6G1IVX7_9PLEO|nr:hypothetical protein K458DRAFT_390894 [Lentithecium fluviatile CBS 122367]